MLIASSPTASHGAKPAKILMLHGHGQSGSFFYYKTHFLRKALQDVFSSGVEFYYPNATTPFVDSKSGVSYIWGYGDIESEKFIGIEESIPHIIDILNTHGPFTGIVGFSCGAALAAIMASILEGNQPGCISLPKINHPPVSFVISYSGFKFRIPRYESLYSPRLVTPVMGFIGELDTMIPGYLTRELADSFENSSIKTFWGTHYVPREAECTHAAREFVRMALNRMPLQLEGEGDWIDI